MKIKIVMDSGKEYDTEFFGSVQDLVDACYDTTEIENPFGGSNSITKFSNKFVALSDKITINTVHISSLEVI